MNDSFTFLIIVTAMLIVTVALLKIGKVRYVYIVPEGYAGLLYHKGKFVETLGAGRHVRRGRRVLEGNPALMNLRLIQSLTAAQNTGNTLVVGMPDGFVPLKNGKSGAHGSTTHEDGAS